MQTYYHTFGLGHAPSGKVQPIVAESATEALRAMFKKYGNRWAFQYTKSQWKESQSADKLLPTIKAPLTNNYKEKFIG